MEACGGATVAGSVQQQAWGKLSLFPLKVVASRRFLSQRKALPVKPLRAARVEGSLVTGQPHSSASVPVHDVESNKSVFLDNGLSEADPEVRGIIDNEKERQFKSL